MRTTKDPLTCENCGKVEHYNNKAHHPKTWATQRACSNQCARLLEHPREERPPFDCVVCGETCHYVHRKHRRLDWANKVTCSLKCHNVHQKGRDFPSRRMKEPAPRTCEHCKCKIYYSRELHRRPYRFSKIVTCGKKECHYTVAVAKARPKKIVVARIKCAIKDCDNVFPAYGQKKYCSIECGRRAIRERAAAVRAKMKRTCERCGCKYGLRKGESFVHFKRRRFCSPCHRVWLALHAGSFEAIMARKSAAVRKSLAGIVKVFSDEARENMRKAHLDPITKARKRLLENHRRGIARESW